MNERQYFGQFSGEDYRTIIDWRRDTAKAWRQGSLGELARVMNDYLKTDWTFRIMLSTEHFNEVASEIKVLADIVRDLEASHNDIVMDTD